MYRRILAPTDGSSVSHQAAANAIAFARACGAELVALSVAVPAPAFQSLDGAMAIDPGLQLDELLRHAQGYADAVAGRAREAGVACTPVACSALDAATAIVEAARAHGCDLIVMGSHGRRGLGRLLAGSVTQAVLVDAPVPVMVLRPSPAAPGAPGQGGSGPAVEPA